MIPNKVFICGVPHQIVMAEDKFDIDLHLGQINYANAEILIRKDASPEMQEQALVHEVLHGILVHIGRNDESNDETFVQALAAAIYQTFGFRVNDA